jgi:hypothetical protein
LRSWEIRDGVRKNTALLIGLAGPSGSGKTYSALRLATGIAKVYGGKPIVVIDTEARRALHYADKFKFKHIDFAPPFSSDDYRDAIDAAAKIDPGCIVIDSMTHEHSGEGGMLDFVEAWLDKRAGDDFAKRKAMGQLAFAAAKGPRKKMEGAIVQISGRCPMILCYRAKEKLDFKHKDSKGQPTELGFQSDTTGDLLFDMTQQFLLLPNCKGKPIFTTSISGESKQIKTPEQFTDYMKEGETITEAVGERMARWVIGDADATAKEAPGAPDDDQFERTELRDTILAVVKEHGIPPEHVRSIIQKIKPNAKLDDLNIDERRAVLAAVKEAA